MLFTPRYWDYSFSITALHLVWDYLAPVKSWVSTGLNILKHDSEAEQMKAKLVLNKITTGAGSLLKTFALM